MPDQSLQSPLFHRAALSQLACPVCYGDLRSEDGYLVCITCRRVYPVIDGIPVLIVERAESPANQGEKTTRVPGVCEGPNAPPQ